MQDDNWQVYSVMGENIVRIHSFSSNTLPSNEFVTRHSIRCVGRKKLNHDIMANDCSIRSASLVSIG